MHSVLQLFLFILSFRLMTDFRLDSTTRNEDISLPNNDTSPPLRKIPDLYNWEWVSKKGRSLSEDLHRLPTLRDQHREFRRKRRHVRKRQGYILDATLHVEGNSTAFKLFSESRVSDALQAMVMQIPTRSISGANREAVGLFSAVAERQLDLLRLALPYAANHRLLQELIVSNAFTIHLATMDTLRRRSLNYAAPTASFAPPTTITGPAKLIIMLESDADFWTLRRALSNELYHAIIRQSNLKKLTPIAIKTNKKLNNFMYILKPFLTSDGEIDALKLKQLNTTLRVGFARIESLLKLHVKHKRMRAKFQVEKPGLLQSFYAALSSFHPETFPGPFYSFQTMSVLLSRLPALSSGRLRIRYFDAERYIHRINHGSDGLSHYLYSDSKGESSADKANAFFLEMKDRNNSMRGAYQQQLAFERYPVGTPEMELSSYLYELPGGLLQVVFPEWCEYHAEQTGEPNFCGY